MTVDPGLPRAMTWTAIIAGFAAGLMYPIRAFLPVPDTVTVALFIFFGPVYAVAILGLFPFLGKPRVTLPLVIGTVFGVVSGVLQMTFAVVQMENLHYIRGYIAAAATSEAAEAWRNILRGVFTVQNGLNYVTDFFLDWCVILLALVMWRHPRFGKAFAITGIVAGGSHFLLKLWTFPEPPASAGLFDAGPLVSAWFTFVVLQVALNIRWVPRPGEQAAA